MIFLQFIVPVPAVVYGESSDDQTVQVVDEDESGVDEGDTIQVVDENSVDSGEDNSYSEEPEEDIEEDAEGESAETESGASLSGDTEMIAISTEMGIQSVVNGRIPLIIRITPHIDSSKAQVRWDLPRGLVTSDPVDLWFEMEDGVTREFNIEVVPVSKGSFETVVDVTAWRYDTNYVSSAVFRFDIDEDLTVTPAPDAYTRSLTLYRLALALMSLIAIIVAIFSLKFGIKQFKKWLAED